MVRSGELAPLDRVPSENELSERLGVSRMTARKALDRLVAANLIFRRPGKGTFVGHPKISHGPSQLLSFSAAMDAQGVHHSTRVLEARLTTAPRGVAKELGLEPRSQVVMVRRLRLIDEEPAAIHTSILPARFAGILDRNLTSSLTEAMLAEGAWAVRTDDTIEVVLASGRDARLLKVATGSPLVFITGVAYSDDMEPLRHSHALYRGDWFRFRIDTTRGDGTVGGSDLRMEHKCAVNVP